MLPRTRRRRQRAAPSWLSFSAEACALVEKWGKGVSVIPMQQSSSSGSARTSAKRAPEPERDGPRQAKEHLGEDWVRHAVWDQPPVDLGHSVPELDAPRPRLPVRVHARHQQPQAVLRVVDLCRRHPFRIYIQGRGYYVPRCCSLGKPSAVQRKRVGDKYRRTIIPNQSPSVSHSQREMLSPSCGTAGSHVSNSSN